ncbi:MAG: rhomboid family intramembrane serine protease [Peptococcaceae bacterium]|nr:rhomboid family intramembrane serine protease [Peptococcaceae bacterium]
MNFRTYIRTYPITCGLIGVILFVFLLMTLAGGSEKTWVLIAFGAKYKPAIQNGEYWRLITCNFLHIGFMHLVLNMVALISLGGLAETLFRKVRYGLLILLSGVGASAASLVFNPDATSAGASGSVFGLVGALMAYAWKDPRFRSSGIVSSLVVLVIINLIFGFTMPYIDNAGHIGGLISGLVIGGVFRLFQRPVS